MKLALQVEPQSMPAGELETEPLPDPAKDTLRTGSAAAALNVAVAVSSAVKDRVQEPLPLHAPDQPAKVEPEAAVAVRVMEVPLSKLALQVEPQLMPLGVLVTVPEPLPLILMVS